MKRHPILLHSTARLDLDRARAWCRNFNGLSRRFADEFQRVLAELRETPRRWSIWRPPDLRRRVFQDTPFVLWYRLLDIGEIEIRAVLHQRKDLARRFPEAP